MQGAKKQCGFALCLMQILYENTICRMVFEKIKPGVIFDLDALSLGNEQRDLWPVGLGDMRITGCF
jgi:hypothetical protein